MKHRGAWSVFVLLAACGTEPGGEMIDPIDPPIVPPTELSPIERCLADGGELRELWATSNQHGPVTSIAALGTTIVLGSADGSVKQWDVDGTSPSYGRPFLDDTGVEVGAVAFTGDGDLAGADVLGRVTEWRLVDASTMRMTPVGDSELVALAGNASYLAVARGELSPELTVVTRATGAVSAPLETTLWGARAVAFASGGHLFTAGHNYGTPQIERRIAASPHAVDDVWNDQMKQGHVLSLAVDAAVTTLAAGGSGFVAVFDPEDLTEPRSFVEAPGHEAVGTATLGRDLFATAGREGTLKVWSKTAESLRSLPIPAPVGLGIDGAGTTLFTSGPDGDLHAFGCR